MRALSAVVLATFILGVAGDRGRAAPGPECPPGAWIRSETAAWLRRVVEVAGYPVTGCTGAAWIARTPLTSFYVWTTEPWLRPSEFRPYAIRTPYPAYTDGTRLVWPAQGLGIWLEPGPSATDVLPGRTALGWLQIASRLPRRYRPIELMPTPPGVLARCRSDRLLRPACPARIPRVAGWETYPRRELKGIFGIQRGGEIPGRPELMRPPHVLHLEVAVRPDRWVPFRWPATRAVAPEDGLVHRERTKPVFLGRVRWGGRSGSVALAPGYPTGGSQGNHVMFRWRQGRDDYVVGLHAWEPFSEAYATLGRVVSSLPRG